jgi:mono/diheme cytochrome c family protein
MSLRFETMSQLRGRLGILLLGGCLVSGTLWGQAAAPVRGDSNSDGRRDITDAVFILNFLFSGGGAPICTPIADTNDDNALNLSDPIFLLGFLFLGAATPPALSEDERLECLGLDPAAIERGMEEYEESDPDGNLFSCALCHSMSPDSESDIIRPGHTLHNALARPSYKAGAFLGGGLEAFVGAVNVCRNDWMAIFDPFSFEFVPWEVSDGRFQDLVAFMRSLQTSDSEPSLEYEIVAPKTGPLDPAASAEDGCRLFNRACMTCHGIGGTGTQLAPSMVDLEVVELDQADYVRSRIRLSGPNHPEQVYKVPEGFELLGTVMPFWTGDRLSDAEVESLAAFVARAREEKRAGNPTFDCVADPGPEGAVVRRGTFTTRQHRVSGTAEELDNRKIRLTNFNYDGGGIVVKVWLFSSTGNIRAGRAIGPDLLGQPQNNSTLVIDIPAEIAADTYDSVSIWCVSARVDFGSALLVPVQ